MQTTTRKARGQSKPNPRDAWPAWTDWARPVLGPNIPALAMIPVRDPQPRRSARTATAARS